VTKPNINKDFLKKIKDKIIIFHYASSSITETPIRISSIAIYDTSEELLHTFQRNSQEDNTEIELLKDFLSYVKKKLDNGFYFMGFNINKPHYGYDVLKQRYTALTKKKIQDIPTNRIYDLDAILRKYYTNYYGGLHILADANKIRLNNFVMGIDELKLFEQNKFQQLNLSTYTKANIIYKVFMLFLTNNLKVTNDGGIVYSLEDADYYKRFLENMNKIRGMIDIKDRHIHTPQYEEFLRNLLFINIITSMETYLSDAFIYNLKKNERFLKKFIQVYKDKDFANKSKLSNIIDKYKDINNTTIKEFLTSECLDELKNITFHKLDFVKEMYMQTYGVIFPSDLKKIFIAIKNRHGLVHRNGKDENGSPIDIKIDYLKETIKVMDEFIKDVDSKLKVSLKNN
jgi:hypothetical protein